MKETLKATPDGAVHEIETAEGQKLTINLTAADLANIVARAVREAKEPDLATQEKIAAEKAQRKAAMDSMMREADEMEKAVSSRQNRCTHRKPDQSGSVYGQVHSDGKIHPICIICHKLFTPYDAPREMIAGGF